MGIRDQFEKLRNYFVEDDEEEEYREESYTAEEDTSEAAPVSQPDSQPQTVQARIQPQPIPPQPTIRPAAQSMRGAAQAQQTKEAQRSQQPGYSMRQSVGASSGINTNYTPPSSQPRVTSRASTQPATVAMAISIQEPRIYNDIMTLANQVRGGQSVVINFKNMADQQARRSIDFLTGIAYCIEGDIQNIGGQIFLVTPTGVTVEGAQELSILAGKNFEHIEF